MQTLFTPQQANKTLPLVKRIVSDILQKGQELRSLAERRDDPEIERRFDAVEDELRGLMREMERVGCYYKDWGFEMGLVDFPAKIDGAEVFLCWRSDEEAVTWFHTAEEGFAGRQPIPEHLLTADQPG